MTSAAHIKVRRSRAVWDRSASDSRLLPKSSPNIVSLLNTPSGDGRSIDSARQALLQGNHCRDYAPLTGRVFLAAIDLVGESVQPAIGGIRAIAPSHDSTVVPIGELRFNHDGLESMFPFLRVVERHCWTGKPHTKILSTFLHILKNVWGRRRVVADVEHPLRRTTGIGAGVAAFLRKSPGPSIASPSPIRHSREVGNPGVVVLGRVPTPPDLLLRPLPRSGIPRGCHSRGGAARAVAEPPRRRLSKYERGVAHHCKSVTSPCHHTSERRPPPGPYPQSSHQQPNATAPQS